MRLGPDYTCDTCKARLSDRGTGEPHLSITIGPGSGLAEMGDRVLIGWRIRKLLRPRRYHWCSPECMVKFFERTLYAEKPFVEYVN